MLMKRSLYTVWYRFIVICLRIIFIPRFIFGYFTIIVTNIIADVDIFIFILSALCFKILFCRRIKFILILIKLVVIIFFGLFQCRIFLKFLLYPLFKIGSRHLQQLHQLNLLR